MKQIIRKIQKYSLFHLITDNMPSVTLDSILCYKKTNNN